MSFYIDMLSVALTKGQHRVFTNRWRDVIGYLGVYKHLKPNDILNVARKVYEDTPELLEVVEAWFHAIE